MNPLLVDPSRTTMLRSRFSAEMVRRFNKVRESLTYHLVMGDSFLQERSYSRDQQLDTFNRWFTSQIGLRVVSGNWMEMYLEEAWRKGLDRSFNEAMKVGLWTGRERGQVFDGMRNGFRVGMLNSVHHSDNMKLLNLRATNDLKGIVDAVIQNVSRVAADNLALNSLETNDLLTNVNPRQKLARDLADIIDKIGKTRGRTLANTEIIRAHSWGQLDALESLGVTEVMVIVEWMTVGDIRVCPECRAMSGVVIKLSEARGLIPLHPRCRCAFKVLDSLRYSKGQKRSQKVIQRAFDKAGIERTL